PTPRRRPLPQPPLSTRRTLQHHVVVDPIPLPIPLVRQPVRHPHRHPVTPIRTVHISGARIGIHVDRPHLRLAADRVGHTHHGKSVPHGLEVAVQLPTDDHLVPGFIPGRRVHTKVNHRRTTLRSAAYKARRCASAA